MSVRRELDFQIGDLVRLSRTGEKQLDDLVLPEPIRPAGRRGRRRIAEPGRVDLQREAIAPPCQRHLDDLIGTGRPTVPSRCDAESDVQALEPYGLFRPQDKVAFACGLAARTIPAGRGSLSRGAG